MTDHCVYLGENAYQLDSELPIGFSVFSERFLDIQLGNSQFGSTDSSASLGVDIVDSKWTTSEIRND